MAEPISFNPQSSNQLPGDTSPDTARVLYRGRERIETTDWSLSGSWYSAEVEVDLGQFQFAAPPMIEFYTASGGSIIKAPYTLYNGTSVVANAYATISTGTKSGGESSKLTFIVGGIFDSQMDIYYQIMSTPAIGGLFP